MQALSQTSFKIRSIEMGKFNIFGTEFRIAGQKRGPNGYPVYQEQAQYQRGIHTPVSGVTNFPDGLSQSEAGGFCVELWSGKPHRELRDHGRELHRKMLAEIRLFPKPNLP
jgi:hypothetical protein